MIISYRQYVLSSIIIWFYIMEIKLEKIVSTGHVDRKTG